VKSVKKLIFSAIAVLFVASMANAQSTMTLQKQCAEGAQTFVERLNSVVAYTSHYNKKLDGCFIRVGFYLGQIKEDVKLGDDRTTTLKHPHSMAAIYNVFEGKMIGICSSIGMRNTECWVGNITCKRLDEFEVLIKKYMEE
jgi:hypothetical protein